MAHFEADNISHQILTSCQEKLKLSAQVFRKSGKIWLETTFTDSWTLKKQNLNYRTK